MALGQPVVHGGHGAEQGIGRIRPDGDVLALAVLVGLLAAHQHAQPSPRHAHDVAELQGDQFGAAQGGPEA